ncbi:MAG: hypothetical protein ABXS91_01315 [Sulfurimonas sp.]
MKFIQFTILLLITIEFLQGNALEHNRGSMQITGFVETSISPFSQDSSDIFQCDLNSVILYDYHLIDPDTPKNILSKAEIAQFSKMLQACSSCRNFFSLQRKKSARSKESKAHTDFTANFQAKLV